MKNSKEETHYLKALFQGVETGISNGLINKWTERSNTSSSTWEKGLSLKTLAAARNASAKKLELFLNPQNIE